MCFKRGSVIFFAVMIILVSIPDHTVSASETGGSKKLSYKESENSKIDPDVELDKLNKLIDRGVKNADVYYNRAWLYALKGEVDKAKNDYTYVIELDNRYADAYFNRGLILLKEGLYKEAVNDFSKAVDINPRNSDAYCNRGNAFFQMGKALLALKDYSTAIEISGEDPDLYINRAIIYQTLGRNSEAKDDLSRASELREKARNQMTDDRGQMVSSEFEVGSSELEEE